MNDALRAAVRDYLAAVDEYEALKNRPGCCQIKGDDPRRAYALDRITSGRDRMREALSAAPVVAERQAA